MHRPQCFVCAGSPARRPLAIRNQRGRRLSCATAPHRPTFTAINAARYIRYRKQSYHFPTLHKGDVIEVNEVKDHIDFAYLGNVVQSIRKPLRQHTATTRKVQTGGLVKFEQQRIQLDLPKGTHVVVLREGRDSFIWVSRLFRMTGREKCHPRI